MNKQLSVLRCVDCGGKLFQGEGYVGCESCKRRFRVKEGVIDMLTKKSMSNEHNQQQNQYYEKEYESSYANKDFEWRKRYKKRLVKYLPKNKNLYVLDVASGQGYMTLAIAKKGYKVVACDIALSGLLRSYKYAKKMGIENNIHFVLGDVNKLKFASNTFGMVILLHVLEHVQDDQKLLRNLFKYSQAGCLYYIGVPLSLSFVFPLFKSMYIASDKKVGHLRRYTIDSISSLFGKSGKAMSVIYTGHLIKFVGVILSLFHINSLDRWIEDIDERSLLNKHWASNMTVVYKYI